MFESLLVAKNGDACVDDVRIKPTEIREIGFGSASSAENGKYTVQRCENRIN